MALLGGLRLDSCVYSLAIAGGWLDEGDFCHAALMRFFVIPFLSFQAFGWLQNPDLDTNSEASDSEIWVMRESHSHDLVATIHIEHLAGDGGGSFTGEEDACGT